MGRGTKAGGRDQFMREGASIGRDAETAWVMEQWCVVPTFVRYNTTISFCDERAAVGEGADVGNVPEATSGHGAVGSDPRRWPLQRSEQHLFEAFALG